MKKKTCHHSSTLLSLLSFLKPFVAFLEPCSLSPLIFPALTCLALHTANLAAPAEYHRASRFYCEYQAFPFAANMLTVAGHMSAISCESEPTGGKAYPVLPLMEYVALCSKSTQPVRTALFQCNEFVLKFVLKNARS